MKKEKKFQDDFGSKRNPVLYQELLLYSEKTPYEKAQEVSNPSMLSVKTSPALVHSPKRGQKKEDGWKEVVRKYGTL